MNSDVSGKLQRHDISSMKLHFDNVSVVKSSVQKMSVVSHSLIIVSGKSQPHHCQW